MRLVDSAPSRRDASVVICTVNRPILLRKAVASVERQRNLLGLDYEIVVVDNSAEGRWRELVAELSERGKVPIRYVGEPRMSFAFSRNAGVRAATGDLVAFLDDDEEASPDWLDRLVETLRRFDADVVFGPVLPVFEGGRPPSWDPEGRHYTRDPEAPTGAEVGPRGTGNALIKRATCLQEAEPFAQHFGSSGGEDLDFFMRLRRRGRELVWCATAQVTEVQPESSLSLSHRSFRVFCLNQTYVKVRTRNAGMPPLLTAYLMAVGAAQVLIYALPAAASWLSPKRPFIGARFKLCGGLGKLLWMLPSRLYAGRYGAGRKAVAASPGQDRPATTAADDGGQGIRPRTPTEAEPPSAKRLAR
ncbi:MAG: glycosyltransferase family 2 protein [Kiloniellales bacterium]